MASLRKKQTCDIVINRSYNPKTKKIESVLCEECTHPPYSRCLKHSEVDASDSKEEKGWVMVTRTVKVSYPTVHKPFIQLKRDEAQYWQKVASVLIDLKSKYPGLTEKNDNWRFDTIDTLQTELLAVLAKVHDRRVSYRKLDIVLEPLEAFVNTNWMNEELRAYLMMPNRSSYKFSFRYRSVVDSISKAYMFELMSWYNAVRSLMGDISEGNTDYIGTIESAIIAMHAHLQESSHSIHELIADRSSIQSKMYQPMLHDQLKIIISGNHNKASTQIAKKMEPSKRLSLSRRVDLF